MANTKKKTLSKPRIRKRKSRRRLGAQVYRNYSDEMLQIACDVVASKQITSRDAERQFGIPRRTIVNKVNQCHLKQANNIKSGFKATGIYPFNPREVLKRIPDDQDEILSYGIEEAFLNYLKETRTEKPMEVRRSKKIQCEPGKSVTVADINLPNQNQCTTKRVNKGNTKNKQTLLQNHLQVNQDDDINNNEDDLTGFHVDLRANIIYDEHSNEVNCKPLSHEIESDRTKQGYLDEKTGMYIDTNAIDYDMINSWVQDDNSIGQTMQLQNEIDASFDFDSDATVTMEHPMKKNLRSTNKDILKRKIENRGKPSTSKGLTDNNPQIFFRPFTFIDSDTDTDTDELPNIQIPQTKPRQVTETKSPKVTVSTHCQETGTSLNSTIKSLAVLSIQKINATLTNSRHHQATGTLQNFATESSAGTIMRMPKNALPSNDQQTVQQSLESYQLTDHKISKIMTSPTSNKSVKPSQSKKITILEDKYLSEEERLSFATFSTIFKPSKKKITQIVQSNQNKDIYCDSDTDESWNEYKYRILSKKDETDVSNEEDSDKENNGNETTYDNTVNVGSYVLVRFTTKKSDKYYSGLIVEKYDAAGKSFKVRFLRKTNNNFVWPQVDDISFVLVEDIAAVLPSPNSGRRGKLTFNFDFSNYKVF